MNINEPTETNSLKYFGAMCVHVSVHVYSYTLYCVVVIGQHRYYDNSNSVE